VWGSKLKAKFLKASKSSNWRSETMLKFLDIKESALAEDFWIN